MPRPAVTTRRSFLRNAAAAIAFPYLLPRAALGSARRAAASERIALGLIGLGNMGTAHLKAFLGYRDVQVLAVCDVDRTKRDKARQTVAERYGSTARRGCAAYHAFEELLARDDLDAVVIAVPEHWHAIIAIAACRAGKDVYCEKPLALTVREARAMVRAARLYDRVFQTGSQQRSAANFRYACELVSNERIGKLQTVHVGVGGSSHEAYLPEEPVPDGFDWDRWLGPAPWAPYNHERASGSYSGGWRLIRDYSGGMMTDWGAHHFDIAQWGMGTDHTGPVEIHPARENADAGDDQNLLTYVYASGVRMYRGKANGILFTGTEGRVEVNRGYFRTWPESIGREPIGPNEIHLYESRDHRQNWLDCIRTRRRPIADVEIGCRSVTVCHLGNIATWLGRSIRWDPQKEEIIGDPEASRWLDRPKRAPWRTYL